MKNLKKWISITITVLIFVGILLYFVPYPVKIDKTLTGYYYEKTGQDEVVFVGQNTITIKGTYYHYLFKRSVFKGGFHLGAYQWDKLKAAGLAKLYDNYTSLFFGLYNTYLNHPAQLTIYEKNNFEKIFFNYSCGEIDTNFVAPASSVEDFALYF